MNNPTVLRRSPLGVFPGLPTPPTSLRSRKEGCEMQRKSLLATVLWPRAAGGRLVLGCPGRGLRWSSETGVRPIART